MITNEVELLLVEDNPDDVELTLNALRRNGLANNVQVARDGAEARSLSSAPASMLTGR